MADLNRILIGTRTGASRWRPAAAVAVAAGVVVLIILLLAGRGPSYQLKVNGLVIQGDVVRREIDRRMRLAEKGGSATGAAAEQQAEGKSGVPAGVLPSAQEESADQVKKVDTGEGSEFWKQTARSVATEMIRAEIVRQKAVEMGVSLPADEVNRRLAVERGSLSEEEFATNLEGMGLTVKQLKEQLENNARLDAISGMVCADISVTNEQAEDFYLTESDRFVVPAAFHLAEIVVTSSGQAALAYSQIQNGQEFAEVAMRFSIVEATKGNGGDIGWIEEGANDPVLEERYLPLGPGDLTGVIEAADGFHIIKVLDRRESRTPSYQEVAGEAMSMLLSKRKTEAFQDWLRSSYANAAVETGGLGRWEPSSGMVLAD